MRRSILLLLLALSACNEDSREPIQVTGPIVFIGDSITQLWPVEDYIEGAVNMGVSGNETPQMLDRFDRDVLSRQPVMVVIHGGINDIRNQRRTDCGSLLAMVEMARAANIKVVVGTVMLADSLGGDRKLKKQLIGLMNDEIRVAADSYGFAVVDYFSASTSARGLMDRGKFPDGLHPNRRGYDAMWKRLEPVLSAQGVVRGR
jgi:acyl-CoA thioesterase I